MRRTISAFLLICLGTLLPLAASPLRLCLLEHRLLASCTSENSPCCPDGDDHRQDPCCVELDTLPDLPAPSLPPGLPSVAEIDLPPALFFFPPPAPMEPASLVAATPIRGPDTPAVRRALLRVWRL